MGQDRVLPALWEDVGAGVTPLTVAESKSNERLRWGAK